MNKEEYVKTLKKYYEDNKLKEADSYGEGYTDGLAEALDYATELSKELDEPKKVVIPQLIAKLIEGASVIFGNEPLRIAHGIVAKGTSNDNGGSWLSDVNNQKLLLNAIVNGYEIEKEPKKDKKYRFNISTAHQGLYDTGKKVVILPYKYGGATSAMTMERAKTWAHFNAYYGAGLLEFEKVED